MGIGNIALPLAGTALRSAFACTGGSSPRARGALHLLMTEMAPAEQPSRSPISLPPPMLFFGSQGRDGYQTKPKKSQNWLDLAVSNCVRRPLGSLHSNEWTCSPPLSSPTTNQSLLSAAILAAPKAHWPPPLVATPASSSTLRDTQWARAR